MTILKRHSGLDVQSPEPPRRARSRLEDCLALYPGDALLFLLVGGFLSPAFHGWVLFAVTSGLLACGNLAALDAPPGQEVFSPA